jgi:hypothetical protein
MTTKELEKQIQRLESENKVLRQIISETVKALQNAEKFTSMTTLDTVAYVTNPYKDERKDPFNSPFGSGDH